MWWAGMYNLWGYRYLLQIFGWKLRDLLKNNMYCGLLAFFRLRLISILLKGLVPI